MSDPATDRANLDGYIEYLSRAAVDLTIDDFREDSVQRAARAEQRVRSLSYAFGLVFMISVVVLLAAPQRLGDNRFAWTVDWALSLGGLGGVAHVLVHVLQLRPQQKVRQKAEEIEVVGRIFLGCLFSVVLSLTLLASPLWAFADDVIKSSKPTQADRAAGQLLFPFLCGYSMPLVLGLLDKFVQAAELTLGLNDLKPRRRGRGRS